MQLRCGVAHHHSVCDGVLPVRLGLLALCGALLLRALLRVRRAHVRDHLRTGELCLEPSKHSLSLDGVADDAVHTASNYRFCTACTTGSGLTCAQVRLLTQHWPLLLQGRCSVIAISSRVIRSLSQRSHWLLRRAGHVVPVPVFLLHWRGAAGQLRLVRCSRLHFNPHVHDHQVSHQPLSRLAQTIMHV